MHVIGDIKDSSSADGLISLLNQYADTCLIEVGDTSDDVLESIPIGRHHGCNKTFVWKAATPQGEEKETERIEDDTEKEIYHLVTSKI
jgi:hypothetical protein